MKEGEKQAARLLNRHMEEGNALPESVAFVLWGTDNLKTEGEPIAQALAMMGARPRFDGYGRLCGATLVPLEDLGRPRIDVVMTMSGIFRDLLPLQMKLLAEAAYDAATADEPLSENFVRKHALAYQAAHNCDMETAALRVSRTATAHTVRTSTSSSIAAPGRTRRVAEPIAAANPSPMVAKARRWLSQRF